MNARTHILVLILLAILAAPTFATSPEGEGKGKDPKLEKTLQNDQWDFISINSILMWLSNNGRMAHNPSSDASGLEWPQGSAKYVIFTDGLVWGGKVQGATRVGGATYNAGLQAGPINPDGSAADPADPQHRIYKVRKCSAEEFASYTSTDQSRLRKDYNEWPVKFGAPWIDKNGNGVYEPDFNEFLVHGGDVTELVSDYPRLPGDETLWFVSNDLDSRRTQNLYGTNPIGLEVQTAVWAYRQTGPLYNILFTKYTVINKGNDDLTDAYFSKWSDPDLGDAFDDFVGIDTLLSLGYVYNGLAKDEVYGTPPAAGYDFFQGPIVPSPGDSAVYNYGWRRGYRNLPVSTFAFYINGSGVYKDPELKTPQGSTEMYNYQLGRLWNGNPFIDPIDRVPVTVCLAGDPITKEGWIDGVVSSPGDRRFLMTAGPFTLAVGDTQEVVVSTLMGLGADRLTSLKVLKFYDKYAQIAFDNQFDLPKAPPMPNVSVSLQNERLILNWGEPGSSRRSESFNDRGYAFQGYNVYQFPTKSSQLRDGVRLATYDIEDGVAVIFDEIIDEQSGIVLSMPVQFGNDQGVIREYDVTHDAIIDRPLVNDQPYYFAVTSYAYNPDPQATPRQLESTPAIFEVRPKLADPGNRYGEDVDVAVPVSHTSGTSAGFVSVMPIDPSIMTDHTYEVSFTSPGQVQTTYDRYIDGNPATTDTLTVNDFSEWTLTDITTGQTKVFKSTALDGLEKNYFIVDGYKIGVSGTGYYKQFKWDFDYGKPFDKHDEILQIKWEGGMEPYEAYGSTKGEGGRSWQFGYTSCQLGSTVSQYGSSIAGHLVDRTVEIRFDTTRKSKGYRYEFGPAQYRFRGYYDSPIQVWDVSDANPANHRQLQYAWIERPNTASDDKQYLPGATAEENELLFILDRDYSETPDPTWSDPNFSIRTSGNTMPILYWGHYLRKSSYANNKYPFGSGGTYVITPKVAFSDKDKYVFTTRKSTYYADSAKLDISNINVFPNPYYGDNKGEQNKYQRFVTFNHLPPRAKFKIYTVSGLLVRSFEKNDSSPYATWDLQNSAQLPVASGMYYIHIELPDLGVEKILRLAIVAETQFLDRI